MRRIWNEIDEVAWTSPQGRFVGAGKQISEALGRKPRSHDLNERHPFDVELLRIPPGATPYPYHAHSNYCVIRCKQRTAHLQYARARDDGNLGNGSGVYSTP